jgi:hypothetical protein
MSGPDYLNPESFVPMLRMLYEQCLCCFRYNAEVWLSLALFERDEVPKRVAEAQAGSQVWNMFFLSLLCVSPLLVYPCNVALVSWVV